MTTLDETLEERGTRYGVFYDHAELSQALKDAMRGAPSYSELSADKKEALGMIVHKIARILNGDPNYAASWRDIGGYAKLVEDTLVDAVPCSPDDVVEANAPSVKTVSQIFDSSEFDKLSDSDQETLAVKTAIFAARAVLHIFEADYPEDLNPRRAIEAAEACVLAEFSEEYSKVATARRLSAESAAMRTGGRKRERMVRRDAVYAAVYAAGAVTGPAKWVALQGVSAAEKADPSVEPKIREYLVNLIKEANAPSVKTVSQLFESSEFKNLSELEQKTIAVKTAIFAAGAVLHFFEADYPKDRRPRQAIEAAEACVLAEFSKSTTDEALWSSDAADMAADTARAVRVVGAKRTTRVAWAAKWTALAAVVRVAETAQSLMTGVLKDAVNAVNSAEKADPSVEPKIREYLVNLIKEASISA